MPVEVNSNPGASHKAHNREDADQNNTAPVDESLLGLVADMIALARQMWRDRFALAKAEAQLAFGSLLLLLGLVFALAMTLILVWGLVLATLGYLAFQWGLSGGWVATGLIGAQLLLAWYLLRKIKQVTGWLSFPETRRALSPDPQTEAPPANQDQRPGGATP